MLSLTRVFKDGAHYCYCAHFLRQGSRARPERNAQHAGHADWLCFPYVWEVLVISRGKNASFFNT